MTSLKLAKLPDRVPIKLSISVSPDLHHALVEYSEMYRAAYGEAEPVAELIPAMLGAFLESDRAFSRRKKAG